MHRCHYCGKILHELPFNCRRCGNIFCSEHYLPENHHCSGHHHHEHKPHYKLCENCSRALTGLRFTCRRCGMFLCEQCHLPENHRCVPIHSDPDHISTPSSGSQNTVKPRTPSTPPRLSWNTFRENITLKNFTIFSILLMVVGFLPTYYSLTDFQEVFQYIFDFGVMCFVIAYFLYALKCWGASSQIGAILMITIPLFTYFLSTSIIPDSTTNFLLYLAILFCFYAIISTLLLYIINKVKTGIERHILKRSSRSYRYFTPNISYSIIGVIVVSILMVNYGGISLLSDNSAIIFQSIQKTNSPAYTTSNAVTTSPTLANSQHAQILPTLQPEIVKNIENTVGNSPPPIDITTLERQVHDLINQQRKNNGLSSLSYDSSLASIARKHSADMARNNYFAHVNLQGLDPTGRGKLEGYSCYKNYGSYYTTGIAENIMQNNLYDSVTYYNGIPRYAWNSQDGIAQSTVSGWMGSPGHRKNILTSTYDREGIGIAIASDDKVYITEDFC
jgi:uncharacterized protein YkwD